MTYPPSLVDKCTCTGIDSNYQPINRTSDFYKQTVYVWTRWEGSFYKNDRITFKWYRNEKLDTTSNRWVYYGEWSFVFDKNYIGYIFYVWSYWDYPCIMIGHWKVEIYYNDTYKTYVEFACVVKRTDSLILEQNIKNLAGVTLGFYYDFEIWGPSTSERWGTTPEGYVEVPGNSTRTVTSSFSLANVRTGVWINANARVKDINRNILQTRTLYSAFYVKS